MYYLDVNPKIESYHQSIIINKNDYSQTIIGSNYFEHYTDKFNIKEIQDQTEKENETDFFFMERSEEKKQSLIRRFEKQFNMTSEEFKKLHVMGKLPDACEIMIWEGLLGLK